MSNIIKKNTKRIEPKRTIRTAPKKALLGALKNLGDDSLYDKDFCKWTEKQAKLLQEGKIENLDIEHLREEIESLGKSDKRALKSYLIIILQHLLKINYAPGWQGNSNSWMASIENSRIEIRLLLDDSPSLKNELSQIIESAYEIAREKALLEFTSKIKPDFPKKLPWKLKDIY